MAVGATWVVAWFLPWTSRGLLSTSSLRDGAGLVRSGSVSALVPAWAAWTLLLAPACGLVLVGSATRHGGVAFAVRCVVLVVMSAVFAAGWYAVGELDVDRLGPGGWLTALGVLLGLTGLAEHWLATHPRPRREETKERR
jgi:hypothetical protein